MLKTRIIPLLLVRDGSLKKPVQFTNPRTLSNPISIVRVFESRQVDELVLLDIGRTIKGDSIDAEIVMDMCEELSVPCAYGGGIKSLDDMIGIINAGAEKVVINSAAVETPKLIAEGAETLGSQCVVVSIDAKINQSGSYEVFTHCGGQPTGLNPVDWAKSVEQLGAGEILLNSISHDGMMEGYDLALIKQVTAAVSIPVIAAGGAGVVDDFPPVIIEAGASAVSASSIFLYRRTTPNMVKNRMRKAGIPVRLTGAMDE
jgi:cyclase